jgi:hypothetical protein
MCLNVHLKDLTNINESDKSLILVTEQVEAILASDIKIGNELLLVSNTKTLKTSALRAKD